MWGEILFHLQIVGTIIPFVGIIALLNKALNRTSVYLMLTNIGCLIMNAGYMLLLRTRIHEEGMLANRIEYLGNALFYFFLGLFVVSYLKKSFSKLWFYLWAAVELLFLNLFWSDQGQKLFYNNLELETDKRLGLAHFAQEAGILYVIRYSIIAFVLLGGVIYTTYRLFRTRSEKERSNLGRLAGAEFVVLTSLIISLVLKQPFDVVPLFSALSILSIIVGVIGGEMLSITEMGHEWVFEQMDDAFLIVDETYGYLDANAYAKSLFPELNKLSKNERIPDKFYELFLSEEAEPQIDDKFYKKRVLAMRQKNKVMGYSMLLVDLTTQHQLMDQVMEEKQRADEANQAKSAFMSNMSHEIRTPMNAIVGMTDILLRKQHSHQDTEYLLNIKNSGNALLSIINDILDFSKIESGKLEIIEEDYEPMSLLNDLGMIFLNRIGEKDVELLYDIDPKLPAVLRGDSLRIRQVIINIMNNAIKFTEHGYVRLALEIKQNSGEDMELLFSVKDSGQGIRQEDLGKLFGSFQQVDAQKNHQKEGTGLGLAISRQLVEMMGGSIEVRSEYGEGSEFSFSIPQKVVNNRGAASINEDCPKDITVSGSLDHPDIVLALKKLSEQFDVTYVEYEDVWNQKKPLRYLFMDAAAFEQLSDDRKMQLKRWTTTVCVLQNPMLETVPQMEVVVMNKPLYTLNFCQVINQDTLADTMDSGQITNFTAPQAKVLIVDDTEMNLKVALGLLEPLGMQIDTAANGKQALEMIKASRYDLIFMDHMMPVMDGVEATKKLRIMEEPYYREVPVIALTANVVSNAGAQFRQAGMNDLVSKPINVNFLFGLH